MSATTAQYRLQPGMRVDLGQYGPARVLSVSESSAVCALERETVRDFQTFLGVKVHFVWRGQIVRISPNSEVPIL